MRILLLCSTLLLIGCEQGSKKDKKAFNPYTATEVVHAEDAVKIVEELTPEVEKQRVPKAIKKAEQAINYAVSRAERRALLYKDDRTDNAVIAYLRSKGYRCDAKSSKIFIEVSW